MGASLASPSSSSLAETASGVQPQASNWSFSGANLSSQSSLLVTRQGHQQRLNWICDRIGSHSINPQNIALHNNFMGSTGPFTPKILSGINAEDILLGRESYDSFSSNCWLENQLHMFGTLDSNHEASNGTPAREGQQDSTPADQRGALGDDQEISSSTVSSRAGLSVLTNSVSRSTISDVTRFYNSCNLSGSAFDPVEPYYPEPPPYSELPDDPPPPYTECMDNPDNDNPQGQHNTQSERGHACDSLFSASRASCTDILW